MALAERDGCGYAFFYAINDASTMLLTADGYELFLAARDDPGTVIDREIDLPSTDIVVIVEEGTAVRGFTCSDVGEETEVDRTWEVVAGTAHLRLRISDPYWESTGELRLVGVEMRSSDGLDVTVDDIGWTDVLVGTEQG